MIYLLVMFAAFAVLLAYFGINFFVMVIAFYRTGKSILESVQESKAAEALQRKASKPVKIFNTNEKRPIRLKKPTTPPAKVA